MHSIHRTYTLYFTLMGQIFIPGNLVTINFKHLWPQLLWFIIHFIWLKKEIYHKNYGAKQGFPALRKAVTTHMKKYCTFSCVFDIANQLLTCHSPFPPLNQVDE